MATVNGYSMATLKLPIMVMSSVLESFGAAASLFPVSGSEFGDHALADPSAALPGLTPASTPENPAASPSRTKESDCGTKESQ
jgi:hypothetical protein